MVSQLHINNLKWGFNNKPLAQNLLNMDLSSGQFCLILGANGTGKSTLLKTIGGLISPIGGSVLLNDKPLLSSECAFVFTQRMPIPFMKSIDLVCSAKQTTLWSYFKKNSAFESQAYETLKLMDAQDLAYTFVDELSDGEFQKVMIARALFKDAPVLLLDEPTAFLDFQSKQSLFSHLNSIAIKSNKIVLASTHDPHLAEAFGSFFVVLKNNTVMTFNPESDSVHSLVHLLTM
jgi:iron complex transport system ATP-binding protein